MRLNPKEQEKLMLHMAGNLAKEESTRPETELPGSTRLHQFRASGTSKGRKDRCGADAARHKDSNPRRCHGRRCRYDRRGSGRGDVPGWNQTGNCT